MTIKIISLSLVLFGITACSTPGNNEYTVGDNEGHRYQVMTMPDGNDWTVENININLPGSLCYDTLQANCDRYGRLYSWETAAIVCSQLGEGWQLPASDDWKALAKHYGGIFDDSNDEGKGAFTALTEGGSSQFNALLSGGGDVQGGFWRIDAHGFYWTSTELNDSTAWFGNFGKGRPALYLQNDGEKENSFAVRCVKKD